MDRSHKTTADYHRIVTELEAELAKAKRTIKILNLENSVLLAALVRPIPQSFPHEGFPENTPPQTDPPSDDGSCEYILKRLDRDFSRYFPPRAAFADEESAHLTALVSALDTPAPRGYVRPFPSSLQTALAAQALMDAAGQTVRMAA